VRAASDYTTYLHLAGATEAAYRQARLEEAQTTHAFISDAAWTAREAELEAEMGTMTGAEIIATLDVVQAEADNGFCEPEAGA
jgi:hypothetical protein